MTKTYFFPLAFLFTTLLCFAESNPNNVSRVYPDFFHHNRIDPSDRKSPIGYCRLKPGCVFLQPSPTEYTCRLATTNASFPRFCYEKGGQCFGCHF